MDAISTELHDVVRETVPRLHALSEDVVSRRPAPGKWSAKEILGHLIDSASNNHQRFVRAQFSDDLVFAGYAQDDWVRVQSYDTAPWSALVILWQHYNLHLARVIAAVPHHIRTRVHHRHNLDVIAWETVPTDRAVTLDWFMLDYVRHLRHHVAQVFAIT